MYSNPDAIGVHIVGSNRISAGNCVFPSRCFLSSITSRRRATGRRLQRGAVRNAKRTYQPPKTSCHHDHKWPRRAGTPTRRPDGPSLGRPNHKSDVLRLSTHKLSEFNVHGLLRHLRADGPAFLFHAQLIDFGLPGVQGLLPQLRADNDPLTLPLRCASGAGVEDCAPETLRQYSLRSKGTVMSTTPVS